MNKLWGWLGYVDQPANTGILEHMGAKMGSVPGISVIQGESSLAVSNGSSVAHEGTLLAGITGQIRFSEICAKDISPAQHLLALWKSHGTNALEHVHGSFSLAIIDTKANTGLFAIDRMGIQRLCFAPAAHGIIFGSSCDSVLAHPAITRTIDPQGIFNYLYAHMVPAPGSIYKGIEKLLPAQYVLFQNGQIKKGFYWEAAWEDGKNADFSLKSKELHSLLEQSVRDTLDGRRTGSFLSGGTDSSTISGMLTQVSKQPAETFSIGFKADGFDEIEYARLAARHFGTHPHEYYVTPDDVVRAIPIIASSYDEPFGNASAVPTYFCAVKAKEAGIEVMLAGDGGDEIFGGNARYAKQKTFELYGKIPRTLQKKILEPFFGQLPGAHSFAPLRKVNSYIEQANIPLPDRLETYNILRRSALHTIFTPEFLRTINPEQPAEIQREVYFRTRANSPINRMLHLDWKQTLADNDLVKVGCMCEAAGIEVRYPLLDERLVTFAAMLPPNYKIRGHQLRWFYKKSLSDFLPQEILTKSKHGFGLPFGIWMKTHPELFELAHENLRAFRTRGFIHHEYMDSLIKAHQSGHATYYGVMIWVIMMLEQWLQHHVDK